MPAQQADYVKEKRQAGKVDKEYHLLFNGQRKFRLGLFVINWPVQLTFYQHLRQSQMANCLKIRLMDLILAHF